MPITITELARILQLDHSTVAYALSGKGTIKEETRQRVLAKAEELGYVPNSLARRMRSKKTHTIGLVIPDVMLVYNEFVQQLFRGAIKRQYELQIALTEFDPKLEDKAILSLMESRVDGLILKSCYGRWEQFPNKHPLRQAASSGLPVVTYGYPIMGSDFPFFQSAMLYQAEMLVEHLYERGHRQFCWLMPMRLPLDRPQLDCIAGTRSALEKHKLSNEAFRVLTLQDVQADDGFLHAQEQDAQHSEAHYTNYLNQALPRVGIQAGKALMRLAMSQSPRPTAILCQNEATAVGAIVQAQTMNLRIPQDVAIAITCHTVGTELLPISVTTCDMPITQVANRVLDLLFDSIEGTASPSSSVTVEPVLHVGASTVVTQK